MDSVPTLDNSVKVTNYGEVVLESDNSLRFVDTHSNVDIVGFKHAFTLLPGLEEPTFSLKIYSSDDESANDSEWIQIAYVQSSNNLIFLQRVKRYVKFVVEFVSSSYLNDSKFLLLVQVDIEQIVTPVITDHTRNVLSRFPSWTKIYSDSLDRATPSLALPESQAGKMVNAMLNEDLDNIDELTRQVSLEGYISTADTNQIAWLYVSVPVNPGFVKVVADGIELARVETYNDLIRSKTTDHVFYFNFISRELYTLVEYNELLVDSNAIDQILVQNYNTFDEFGLRVGLQRLLEENNDNFKKRILDTYLNPPSININGLKLTLRRELDIWRAYGATPDSNYLGATPEILEVSDLQVSTPYFEKRGTPKDLFYEFVENMNNRFPTNFGYAKWGETYWDYAGQKQEGVSSIPLVADAATVNSEYYQPGIGDFDDAKIILEKLEQDVNEYSFGIRIHGTKSDTVENAYEPVKIAYDTYVSYLEQYYDHEYATISYNLSLHIKPHGNISSNTIYKTSIVDTVRNNYAQNSSASPEYFVKEIFNPSGFSSSSIVFKNLSGQEYSSEISPSATETYYLSQIPLNYVESATIDYLYSLNSSQATSNYAWVQFNSSTPSARATATNTRVVQATPIYSEFTPADMSVKVVSDIYSPVKIRETESEKIRYSQGLTVNESNKISDTNAITIYPKDIKDKFLLPNGAIPLYVHIDNIVDSAFDTDLSSSPSSLYGGVSVNRQDNLTYLIPSSPNVFIQYVNPNFATPTLHQDYVSTVGSTVNYYFTNAKFPYATTPDYIMVDVEDSEVYPFEYKKFETFTADHVDEFSFFLSKDGVVKSSPDIDYDIISGKSSDIVGIYTFDRSDFNLEEYASDPNFTINKIEIINQNDMVDIWIDNSYDAYGNLIFNYLEPYSLNYQVKDLTVKAKYNLESEKYIYPSIRSGWYYFDGEERYIYARPKTETSSISTPNINLTDTIRSGAPIALEVNAATPINYRQVAFHDEATPSLISVYNYEYIIASNEDTIYLAYNDIFDVTIVDTFTGVTVSSGLQSSTNEISNLQLNVGREYKVTYRVRNSYVIDNQIYNQVTDSYNTQVILLTTPNVGYSATVTYETAVYDKDTELNNLSLNPIYSPMDEGYIFISHNEYPAASVDYYLSPKELLSDPKDYLNLTILSKDENGNPKPNQSFRVLGDYIAATPQYVTTDSDGYVSSKIRYNSSAVTVPGESEICLVGLDSSDPNANANSQSDGISATINYKIKPLMQTYEKVLADVDKKILTANGLDRVNVVGVTKPNSYVYWRKARNLYDAFGLSYSDSSATPDQDNSSGAVLADQSGNFTIGSFVSQPEATPGYWFVVIDSELESSATPGPETVSGDIVYWYEKYDANQTNPEELIYNPDIDAPEQFLPYDYNKVFKADSVEWVTIIDDNAATPWLPPSWYPINRFTQYQLGLFGSTPKYVKTFENLHPDYEEE